MESAPGQRDTISEPRAEEREIIGYSGGNKWRSGRTSTTGPNSLFRLKRKFESGRQEANPKGRRRAGLTRTNSLHAIFIDGNNVNRSAGPGVVSQ